MPSPLISLPVYRFKIKMSGKDELIFDEIRKKFVKHTREEWVRQNILQYLIREKNYPKGLIAVETEIKLFRLKKRCDAVIYSKSASPLMIVECKSPAVKISQQVFDQITRYNYALQVPFLLITNGTEHYFCRVDYAAKSFRFLNDIPMYRELEEK